MCIGKRKSSLKDNIVKNIFRLGKKKVEIRLLSMLSAGQKGGVKTLQSPDSSGSSEREAGYRTCMKFEIFAQLKVLKNIRNVFKHQQLIWMGWPFGSSKFNTSSLAVFNLWLIQIIQRFEQSAPDRWNCF